MEFYIAEKEKDELNQKEKQNEERPGTESTKDDTFSSNLNFPSSQKSQVTKEKVSLNPNTNKNNITLSEVAEEDHGVSSRGNTFKSIDEMKSSPSEDLEEVKLDFKEKSFSNNSETDNFNTAVRHSTMNNRYDLGDLETPSDFDILNRKIKKSEIIGKSQIPKNKIKLPKILVLISRYPIYKDLEQFLNKIETVWMNDTSIPIERMITNLVYEFPHPGFKYIVKSKFWGTRESYKFKYETVDSLPFCEPKHFLELSKFYENSLVIWDVLERVLFEDPIILISKSIDSLVSWSEILKNLIFPFKFSGLVIPYMCRPDLILMFLSSDSQCKYMVGLTPDSYKYCKAYLPSNVT